MRNRSQSTLRVEDLERFGKSLSDFPKEAFQGQGKVIFAAFRKKFGLLGLVPFAFRVVLERRRILKQYAKPPGNKSRPVQILSNSWQPAAC